MKDWFTEMVGDKIKAKRKEKGFTQDELGQLIGLTRTSVINIETGRHLPTIKTIYIICGLFNCSYYDLLPKAKPRTIHEQLKTKTIITKKVIRILKPAKL